VHSLKAEREEVLAQKGEHTRRRRLLVKSPGPTTTVRRRVLYSLHLSPNFNVFEQIILFGNPHAGETWVAK
jgi:hypothetical protein